MTPIKDVVVIVQENVSLDHYFATYPYAANPVGEPPFHPRSDTPTVNRPLGAPDDRESQLLQPYRLPRSAAVTCDMDHAYGDESLDVVVGPLLNMFSFAHPQRPGDFQACS